MVDVVIVGAGPAALSAALYLGRAGASAVVYGRGGIGGALQEINHLANYPGFSGTGNELATTMRHQAERAGAKIKYGECTAIKTIESGFELTIDGESVLARSVLVATGSEPKALDFKPDVPVSYCALCDADLVKGKNVAVVGGGNSAVQEGIYLSKIAKKVTIISHSPLKASDCLQKEASETKNVDIHQNEEATPELLGQFDHVFVYIGKRPATGCLDLLQKELRNDSLLDQNGFILTDLNSDFPHESTITGLFAAGDVRANTVHQVVTAAADGASAAVEITRFLQQK